MTGVRVKGPLPFGLKLLTIFLLVEVVEQLVTVGRSGYALLTTQGPLGYGFWSERVAQPVLLLCLCGGLSGLIAYRSGIGRLWAIIFFGFHSLLIVGAYTLQFPDQWPSLSTFDRIRTATTVAIETGFVLYLLSSRARDALTD